MVTKGTARGSNPKQPKIYGRDNLNYQGPEKANSEPVDPWLTMNAGGDFNSTDPFSDITDDDIDDCARRVDIDHVLPGDTAPYHRSYRHAKGHEVRKDMERLPEFAADAVRFYLETHPNADSDDLIDIANDPDVNEYIEDATGMFVARNVDNAYGYTALSSDPIGDMEKAAANIGITVSRKAMVIDCKQRIYNAYTTACPEVTSIHQVNSLYDGHNDTMIGEVGVDEDSRAWNKEVLHTVGMQAAEVYLDNPDHATSGPELTQSFREEYLNYLAEETVSLGDSQSYHVAASLGEDINSALPARNALGKPTTITYQDMGVEIMKSHAHAVMTRSVEQIARGLSSSLK